MRTKQQLSVLVPVGPGALKLSLSGSVSQWVGPAVRVGAGCAQEACSARASGRIVVPRVGATPTQERRIRMRR